MSSSTSSLETKNKTPVTSSEVPNTTVSTSSCESDPLAKYRRTFTRWPVGTSVALFFTSHKDCYFVVSSWKEFDDCVSKVKADATRGIGSIKPKMAYADMVEGDNPSYMAYMCWMHPIKFGGVFYEDENELKAGIASLLLGK